MKKYKRNKKKRYKRSNANPQTQVKVQTLGRGSTTRIVNADYSISSAGTETINLGTLLSNSSEFKFCAVQYRYFKIQKIQLTVFPMSPGSASAVGKPYRILMNWTDDSNQNGNIEYDDSVVLVSAVMRPVTRTWLPPNIQLLTNAGLGLLNALNPRDWIVADDILVISGDLQEIFTYHYPGSLKIKHPSAGNYTISIYVKFRGSKIPSLVTTKRIEQIINQRDGVNGEFKDKLENIQQEDEEPECDEEELKEWDKENPEAP